MCGRQLPSEVARKARPRVAETSFIRGSNRINMVVRRDSFA
jgi:hypothetical protein